MGYTELVTDCRWCRAHGSLEGSNQEVEQRLPGQALTTFVPGVNGPLSVTCPDSHPGRGHCIHPAQDTLLHMGLSGMGRRFWLPRTTVRQIPGMIS